MRYDAGQGPLKNLLSYVPRRVGENLWLPIQVLALAAIIISAFMTSRSQPSKVLSDGEGATSQSFRVALGSRRDLRPYSITSRVVVLPLPGKGATPGVPLNIEVETRQLRFEKNMLSFGEASRELSRSLRRPASEPSKLMRWQLATIRKKSLLGWEAVELVHNESHQTLGSVFVELDEGWNEFQVVFHDQTGREVAYPVRVKHVRKNAT